MINDSYLRRKHNKLKSKIIFDFKFHLYNIHVNMTGTSKQI